MQGHEGRGEFDMAGSDYWTRFWQKRINRRRLIKGAAVGGAGLAAAGVVGCGDDDNGGASPTATADGNGGSPTATPAATPASEVRTGGTLMPLMSWDPPHFDIHQTETFLCTSYIAPAYNGILGFSPTETGVIEGELARDWEISDDGLTYTFTFHPNIKWHDGEDFTSDDAKFSIERMQNPPEGVLSPRQPMFQDIESIDTPDSTTMVVRLSRPSAVFQSNIASGNNMIFPRHVIEAKGDMKTDIVGTGPFRLADYVPGSSIEFERNPEYFLEGLPYLDGVRKLVINDAASRQAALLDKQVHMSTIVIGNPGPDERDEFTSRFPEGRIEAFGGNESMLGVWEIRFDHRLDKLSDARIRQAISWAFDRRAVTEIIQGADISYDDTKGAHMVGVWGLPLPELDNYAGYAQRDVERARELLAEAGASDLSLRLMHRADVTSAVTFAELVQAQLGEAGINVDLDPQEGAAYSGKVAETDYEAYIASVVPGLGGVNDATTVLSPSYNCNGFTSEEVGSFCDDEISQLLTEQEMLFDQDERIAIAQDVQRKLLEEMASVVVTWNLRVQAVHEEVQGWKPSPNGLVQRQQRYEKVWLSA